MKSQLKNVPPEMREKIEELVEKDPQLLMELAQEVQKLMKSGKGQMEAMKHVAMKHQDKLKGLLG